MKNYKVIKIPYKIARDYITQHHYSHGCSSMAFPCYGLFESCGEGLFGDEDKLIGALMFATPCSEDVRASIFGEKYKDWVVELHRLHVLDGTPKNTESWFISRCLKLIKNDLPRVRAVISFSDSSEGHTGIVYQATNFYYCGKTGNCLFYRDQSGRLRHPRQNGVDISPKMAKEMGWRQEKRKAKNRYIYIVAHSKLERKQLMEMCKYKLVTHTPKDENNTNDYKKEV